MVKGQLRNSREIRQVVARPRSFDRISNQRRGMFAGAGRVHRERKSMYLAALYGLLSVQVLAIKRASVQRKAPPAHTSRERDPPSGPEFPKSSP
jgi:hypothetical protein